ncbi:MAG: MBOAT family protein, partial [Myxococcota bacterium]
MEFNSWSFASFFFVVFAGYFVVPGRTRWVWLLGASLYFYGRLQPLLLLQILTATAVTYWLAIKIAEAPEKPHKRKLVTWAIWLLVGNLLVFKYTTFVNESFRSLFGVVGASYPIPYVELILPIGISFYTFQLVSYVVDVHKGTVDAERHFGIFALYVLFFPKVVAGPIERAKSL